MTMTDIAHSGRLQNFGQLNPRRKLPNCPARLRWPSVLLASVAFLIATPALADVPAVIIADAPIVAPSAALTYYGNPASPTPPASRDPLVEEIARSLRYDVDRIFEHVRDNVEFVPIFGVQKGARGIVLDGHGTAFDQAQFMVEALRESDAQAATGYNPRYELGKITLAQSDFASWTGVGDAATATKLLARGGIPATVTGSGSSFSVELLHVWVKATIGGTDYVFDPSFKPHQTVSGINWQGNTGYSKATLLASGGGANATVVNGFNDAAFRQKLTDYRSNVEAFLAANAAGKRNDAVVGYRQIQPHAVAERRRTTLPYASGAPDRTWDGQIPDVYRASFSVALNGTSAGTYFADTVGGQARLFNYYYNKVSNTFQPNGSSIAGINADYNLRCSNWLGDQPAAAPAIATISIQHPYAANGGTYADRVLSKKLVSHRCGDTDPAFTGTGQFIVTNDWGYTGGGVKSRMSIPAERIRISPLTDAQTMMVGPTLASIANHYSQFLDTAGSAGNNLYFVHDLIGLHTVDKAAQTLTPAPTTSTPNSMLTFDFEAAVSTVPLSGGNEAAAAFTAGIGLSLVEGAVPRQETDAVYDMAAINLFTQQQARATSNSPNSFRTFLATPITWSTIRPQLADYPAAALTTLDAYVAEGYSVLVPEHGSLRQPKITVTDASLTRTATLIEGSSLTAGPNGPEIVRTPFLAWKANGSVPERVALVIYDPRHDRPLKGGVGVAHDPITKSIRPPDIPKAANSLGLRNAVNVDGKGGSFTYSPAPDLVDGAGEFPYSLSFQRSYDQSEASNYGVGMGWKTNWNQVASLTNDGKIALGGGGAQAAGSMLVATQALNDIPATLDAQHLYATAQIVAWIADQSINNAAVVTPGLDKPKTFYRQASGGFVSADASGEMFIQAGNPQTGILNRRLYYPVSFTYSDKGGTVRSYPYIASQVFVDSRSDPGIASQLARKSIYLETWNFPSGVRITTGYYNPIATPEIFALHEAKNNLGSSIKQHPASDYGSQTLQPRCPIENGPVEWLPARDATFPYSTSTGVTVTIVTTAQVRYGPNLSPQDQVSCKGFTPTWTDDGGAIQKPVVPTYLQSNIKSVADTTGKVWKYGTAMIMQNPVTDPTFFGGYVVTDRIYKSTDPANAALTVAFGRDANVRTITDLNTRQWSYFSSAFRSEILSPLQKLANPANGAVTYYDRWGQSVRSLDPLLRTTTTAYDDLGRVTQTTAPEGNSELTGYDARGNVISKTLRAKPATGLADLVTTTAYVEGANVTTCTNLVTCNRPAHEIDAKGNRKSWTWDATHGQLLSQTAGLASGGSCLMAGGVCPQTSYGYTGFAALGGTTLQLPTTKVELIAAGNSTTTLFQYNTANKFTIRSVTTDDGGLTLRTCYSFDAGGNLTSKTDPKAGIAVCP